MKLRPRRLDNRSLRLTYYKKKKSNRYNL